ncbi:hypothetical protein KKG82_05975 [Patescibacteria group bacterium]|nr:hypothetical protein [Patescibacteria group bacterium]
MEILAALSAVLIAWTWEKKGFDYFAGLVSKKLERGSEFSVIVEPHVSLLKKGE